MVKVLFFASLRESLGCAELLLTLDHPLSVQALKQLIGQKLAGAEAVLIQTSVLCAVNHNMESADSKVLVQADDEVAFFPPVTGG